MLRYIKIEMYLYIENRMQLIETVMNIKNFVYHVNVTLVLIKIFCLNSRRHSCTWVFCSGSVQHGHRVQQQGINIWEWGSRCPREVSWLQWSWCSEKQCRSPSSVVIGKERCCYHIFMSNRSVIQTCRLNTCNLNF